VFTNFLPKKGYNPLSPPYTPDSSPSEYSLLPKLKMTLKRVHFAVVAKIQEAVTDESQKFQQQEFSAAFQKLYDRAKACVYAKEAYFELKKVSSSSIPIL
jgi:hypothetical protein